MITKEKINIFVKYSQDIDAFAQFGKAQEKEIMSDSDWGIINDIIQDILLLDRGLVSLEMKDKIEKKINANIDDIDVKNMIVSLARNNHIDIKN